MTTTTKLSYGAAPNQVIHAGNGIDYAYREIGAGTVPLVLLQHFRGNLENWDPQLVDALASQRRVVAFDNVGVGATTGTTPNTMEQMARDAIAFIAALDAPRVDILGFSIGSFVAQEIALIRPDVVRRLVLASSAPRGGAGMHGWAPEVINAVGKPQPDPIGYLNVFFTSSAWALLPEEPEALAGVIAGMHLVNLLLLQQLHEATGVPPPATLQRLAISVAAGPEMPFPG